MEESRSSGGGGSAVLRESLVGEGLPSASTAVAARLGDYAEIFGDLEGSSSIPFLDLPSAFDGFDGAPPGTLAYSEVFGASYDELFAEREEASSSDARKTTEESTSSHQAMLDLKIFSPSHFQGNHMTMAHEEGDSSSSNSIFDNLSTQPIVPYSQAGQGIREGTSSARTHITQLHTISASSLVIGGTADDPHATLNDSMHNMKCQQMLPTSSSSSTLKTSENYSKADQKHSVSKQHSVVENNSANASYSSRSSSSFTLSGDLSSSDTTDMTVSSVSLRRQPTQVPLTTPLGSKVGFDEVNVMSAAEASDAVVKAMEFAQARLKIAKSLLEKRHQNLQNNKKLGQ